MITPNELSRLSQESVQRVRVIGAPSVYVDGSMPRTIKECEAWYRQDRERHGSALGVQAAAYRRSIRPRHQQGYPTGQSHTRCGGRWSKWEECADGSNTAYMRAVDGLIGYPKFCWPSNHHRVCKGTSITQRIRDILQALRNHKLHQSARECNRLANQMWSEMYRTNWPKSRLNMTA